jgi:hypothetical protein
MMTTKQRALLIFIVIAGAFAVRPFERSIEHAFRQKPPAKPSPFGAAATLDAASLAAPSPPTGSQLALPPGKLSGVWRGSAALEDTGICDLRFELIENLPGRFSGYSNFSCITAAALMSPNHRADFRSEVLSHINPDAAILTGIMQDGAIHFHVDKVIGADINGCSVTSFTVVPFGASQLAAQWQAGPCKGGSILLQRGKA